jgi:hypothetical protein
VIILTMPKVVVCRRRWADESQMTPGTLASSLSSAGAVCVLAKTAG